MNLLCMLGVHRMDSAALVHCDHVSYVVGMQCGRPGCTHVVFAPMWNIRRVVSQAYTDGKMAQRLEGRDGQR